MEKLNFQAVIKSVASAASPKTKIQESRGASVRQLGMQTAGTAPWGSLRFGSRLDHGLKKPSGEVALAADLITAGRTATFKGNDVRRCSAMFCQFLAASAASNKNLELGSKQKAKLSSHDHVGC